MATATLQDELSRRAAPGVLYDRLDRSWVHCYACGHDCRIPPGRPGVCRIRFNDGGVLRVPRGYVGSLAVDPIEKKPFFHVRPGALALSFGMLGCDYHCSYCQNWFTSQALRDPMAIAPPQDISPGEIVSLALESGAEVVTSTYNEPLITSEWAVEIFGEARRAGLMTSYVSNGNATPRVLDYLAPWVDHYKVDLKGFDDRRYRQLGGRLDVVLETIRGLKARGIWVEVVTLLVPDFNDGQAELTALAEFLASVDPEMPWHVTAYHDDYREDDRGATPVRTLLRAVEVGRAAGLRFIYAGNLPGRVGTLENTDCPGCGALLVERAGYRIRTNRIKNNACPDCARPIPGRWQSRNSRETTK